MCRNMIFQDDEDAVTAEETSYQMLPSEESVSGFCQIRQKVSIITTSLFKLGKRLFIRNISAEGDIEMANESTP